MMMLIPQLSSQASFQGAIHRRSKAQKSTNVLSDGRRIHGDSIVPLQRSWDINYSGLTGEEFAALEAFLHLDSEDNEEFIFVDPFCNALNQSEDLFNDVWQVDPGCALLVLGSDAETGWQVHEIANSGISDGFVYQEITISGDGTFCISCFCRSNGNAEVHLALEADSQTIARGFIATSDWSRFHLTTPLTIAASPLRIKVGTAPSAKIAVMGLQLERQPAPSYYKPSFGAGGVYQAARVVRESFRAYQLGPDWHDCSFTVEA